MSNTAKKDKVVKSKPESGPSKNMHIAIVLLLLITVIIGGAVYLVANSKLSNTASEEFNVVNDPSIVEAIKNATPGESFGDINENVEAGEQRLETMTEGSKEWVEQQYDIASMYLSINNFEEAFSTNATALNGAKNLGDDTLINNLEAQKQAITDKRQLLESIGQ